MRDVAVRKFEEVRMSTLFAGARFAERAPSYSTHRSSTIAILALGLIGTSWGTACAGTSEADCSPKLVRAVTHFPEELQQFNGDGVLQLGVGVDRFGRVVDVRMENPRASPKLFAVARASALREWMFDVSGCHAFPARTSVRVEYRRPPAQTFSAMKARKREMARRLPRDAACERNENPRLRDDVVVTCVAARARLIELESRHGNTTAANDSPLTSAPRDREVLNDDRSMR
jgi:hypothetical protein